MHQIKSHLRLYKERDSQNDRLLIDSLLSPRLTNIYPEWIEEYAINESLKRPKLWLRYVDDIFDIC